MMSDSMIIKRCTKGRIAFTFDDGPNISTQSVLKILRNNRTKASFFVQGSRIAGHSATIEEMLKEGHLVGTHTYSHRRLTKLSKNEIELEISSANKRLESITGTRTEFFRPPYGSYNRDVLDVLEDKGMHMALWSKTSVDWLLPGFLMYLNTYGIDAGDIVLFHDSRKTGKYLDRIIKRAKNKGSLVSLESCVPVF